MRLVPPDDKEQVNEIFFGGAPWLVVCVTSKSAAKKPPRQLEAAAEVLRPRGVRVARVYLGKDEANWLYIGCGSTPKGPFEGCLPPNCSLFYVFFKG